MEVDFSRQERIFNPSRYRLPRVVIVGCGNIGSNVAIALVRLGITDITLIDGDIVERHNLSTQHYLPTHVERKKVEALKEQLMETNEAAYIRTVDRYLTDDDEELRCDIVISGVDSLEARHTIKHVYRNSDVRIIDGRLGRQQVEVHCPPTVWDWHIPAPDEVMDEGCAERFIIYTPLLISALIADCVKKITMGQATPLSQIHDFATNVHLVTR